MGQLFVQVHCREAGLCGGVAAVSDAGSFFPVALFPWRVACTRVYSSSSRSVVHSRWASPVDALVGWHCAVCA